MDWSGVSWPWFIFLLLGIAAILALGAYFENRLDDDDK